MNAPNDNTLQRPFNSLGNQAEINRYSLTKSRKLEKEGPLEGHQKSKAIKISEMEYTLKFMDIVTYLKKQFKVSKTHKDFSIENSYKQNVLSYIASKIISFLGIKTLWRLQFSSQDVNQFNIQRSDKENARKLLLKIFPLLAKPIKQKAIDGDFDLILNQVKGCDIKEKIEEELQNRAKQLRAKVWRIPDYLGLSQKIGKDEKVRFYFQLKKNVFNITKDIRKEEVTSQQEAENNKDNTRTKNIQNIFKGLKQYEMNAYTEQLERRLFENNMLHNISQLIKLVLAINIRNYEEWKSSINIRYEEFEQKVLLKRSSSFQHEIRFQSIPKTVLYYVIDNDVQEEQFKKQFDFFKPILKGFFARENAILGVIGFTQYNQIKDMQRKMEEITQKLRMEMEERQEEYKFNLKETKNIFKIEMEDRQKKQKETQNIFKIEMEDRQKKQKQTAEELEKLRNIMQRQREQRKQLEQKMNELIKMIQQKNLWSEEKAKETKRKEQDKDDNVNEDENENEGSNSKTSTTEKK